MKDGTKKRGRPRKTDSHGNVDKQITRSKHVSKRFKVAQVADLLAQSRPEHEIIDIFTTKWGVHERAVKEYINEAKYFLIDINSDSMRAQMGEIIHKLRLLFEDSFERGDNRFCLEVLQEQAKIMGINQDGDVGSMLGLLEQGALGTGDNGHKEGTEQITATFKELVRDPKTRRTFLRELKHQSTVKKQQGTKPPEPEEVIEAECVDIPSDEQ